MSTKGQTQNALDVAAWFAKTVPMSCALIKAVEWREAHKEHVALLEAEDGPWIVPSVHDLNHPEMWKPGSWKWLRQAIEQANTKGSRDSAANTNHHEHS